MMHEKKVRCAIDCALCGRLLTTPNDFTCYQCWGATFDRRRELEIERERLREFFFVALAIVVVAVPVAAWIAIVLWPEQVIWH